MGSFVFGRSGARCVASGLRTTWNVKMEQRVRGPPDIVAGTISSVVCDAFYVNSGFVDSSIEAAKNSQKIWTLGASRGLFVRWETCSRRCQLQCQSCTL